MFFIQLDRYMNVFGPLKSNAFVSQEFLKIRQLAGLISDFPRPLLSLHAERRQRADRLADVPLHWMHAKTAVGQVSDSDVFAGRQKIFHSARNQRAQRDLKRQRVPQPQNFAAG